jgi:hypothetical protein
MIDSITSVWIFHGANGRFSSGVFSEITKAESWIAKHKLTGVLTMYPINEGVYDWAISNSFFEAKTDNQIQPSFIQKFSCASQEHYHYQDGQRDT